MVKSIRTQLVLWLVAGVAGLQIAAGVGLYLFVKEALQRSLDAAVLAKANAITAAIHMEDDGQPHLQRSALDSTGASDRERPFLFQVWRADGSPLIFVGPRGETTGTLPHLPNHRKRFVDLRLTDRSRVRAAEFTFTAQPDEDEYDIGHPQHTVPGERLTMVVAVDRRSMDQPLSILLTGLATVTLVSIGGIVGIVRWGVRRGLHSLSELAKTVTTLSLSRLDHRFDSSLMPTEIRPVADKLNELFERLNDAFQRERRFSADIAHELRTPISELRSACEVALRWPEHDDLVEALSESLAIATQMEQTVSALLSLVRVQAGIEPLKHDHVVLAALVQEVWSELKDSVDSKGLQIDQHFDDVPTVQTDRQIFTQALRNLLGNAVQHTPAAGAVKLVISSLGNEVGLEIANSCDSLGVGDLPHLCEPFWRKDSARSDRHSIGLGLALVQEYCSLIGVHLKLSISEKGWFFCSLRLRAINASFAPQEFVASASG